MSLKEQILNDPNILTMSGRELAEKYGCHFQYVYQIKKAAGIPSNLRKQRKYGEISLKIEKYCRENRYIYTGIIARKFNCSHHTVLKVINKLMVEGCVARIHKGQGSYRNVSL